MHGHEQTGTEHVEKLTGSTGVAVADAPVYGEHHHVETIGELADVFQLAQETRLPAVSITHDTPLSLLPVAVTRRSSSSHVAPFPNQASASSFCARRCFRISFERM